MSELWAIAVALKHEAMGFLPKLALCAETRYKQVRVWEGSLGRQDCIVFSTGMGPHLAERAARFICQEFQITHLLSTGYCGGLSSGMKAGDAVLPQSLQVLGGQETLSSDPAQLEAAAALLEKLKIPIHRGSMVMVERPVLKTPEKLQLAQASGAVAVDMESYAIMQAAQKSGKKIASLTVRFVVDALEDELTDTGPFFSPESGLKPLALMGEILRRPKILLELPGLEHKASKARGSLTPFVSAFFGAD